METSKLYSLLGEYIKKTEETDELRIFNGFCSYLGRTCGIYVTEENAEGILTAVFRHLASGFPLRKYCVLREEGGTVHFCTAD